MGIGSSSGQQSRQLIKQLVQRNCVVIFSTSTCPYCRMAKNVFTELDVSVEVVELNQRRDGDAILRELRTVTGLNTVPQVFVNGTCIGGGSETKQLFTAGRLQRLVEQCMPVR